MGGRRGRCSAVDRRAACPATSRPVLIRCGPAFPHARDDAVFAATTATCTAGAVRTAFQVSSTAWAIIRAEPTTEASGVEDQGSRQSPNAEEPPIGRRRATRRGRRAPRRGRSAQSDGRPPPQSGRGSTTVRPVAPAATRRAAAGRRTPTAATSGHFHRPPPQQDRRVTPPGWAIRARALECLASRGCPPCQAEGVCRIPAMSRLTMRWAS